MRNASGDIVYTTSSQSSSCVGGFAGYVKNSTLNTCFSRGNVYGSATYSGGFVGSVSGSSLSYCYTTKSNFGNASGTHCHATGGKDIDDVCSTCADKFIW